MTTTAKLTSNQRRVLGAVSEDWRSTREVRNIAGVDPMNVLSALYVRQLVDRRRIDPNRIALEWRLSGV